jgi:hypothetical protein
VPATHSENNKVKDCNLPEHFGSLPNYKLEKLLDDLLRTGSWKQFQFREEFPLMQLKWDLLLIS